MLMSKLVLIIHVFEFQGCVYMHYFLSPHIVKSRLYKYMLYMFDMVKFTEMFS